MKVIFLVFLLEISACFGYNILGVFYTPCKSRQIVGQTLLKTLAERGHNVTALVATHLEHPVKNYREIILNGLASEEKGNFQHQFSYIFQTLLQRHDSDYEITSKVLRHSKFEKLIYSDSTSFDLIIIEAAMNEVMLTLGYRFNAPIIWFDTTSTRMWTYDLNGMPVALHFDESTQPGFFGRAMKVVSYGIELFYFNYIHLPQQLELYRNHFANVKNGSFSEMRRNVRLVRVNGDFAQNTRQISGPGTVELIDVAIAMQTNPLPSDVKSFMDESKNGVIYTNLNLMQPELSNETINEILTTIGRRKERVIWNTYTRDLFKIPSNVRISRKAEEKAILSHGNVKLVITHGDPITTMLAILNGIPILGVPILPIHQHSLAPAIREGLALQLNLDDMKGGQLLEDLDRLLYESKFSKTAKSWSELLKTRTASSLSSTASWLEHIVRYNSMQLKISEDSKSFIEYHNIDVIVYWLTIIVVAIYLFAVILKKLLILIVLYYLNLNVKQKSL